MRDIECDMCGEMFGEGFHRYLKEVEVNTPDGLIIEDHCSSCRAKTMRERGALFAAALFKDYTLEELEVGKHNDVDPADMKEWNIDRSTWHDAVAKAIAMREAAIE